MAAIARILVVDDELGMRDGCRRALESLGYAVDTASSGRVGIELARCGHYDLVLLDIIMPDTSGLDVLVAIRKHDPDVVCVIVTGYATIELAVDAVKRGAYDFVSKPFAVDDLARAVSRGLEHRALMLEARRLHDIERQAKELAREKADLERVDKARGELMYTVAHELRAPVAAIQGFLKVILEGYVSVDKSREMLQRAEIRASELIILIQDLLQLANLRQQAPTDEIRPVEMVAVLRDVISMFRVEAEAKHLTVDVAAVPEAWVAIPSERLRQVWTNLISNAIRYTPNGGRITASVGLRDNVLIGAVADTGIGIDDGDLSRVFHEFYRTKEARAMIKEGSGLGLAIVKRILDNYGGRISVQSKVGEGSTFSFEMPVVSPATADMGRVIAHS